MKIPCLSKGRETLINPGEKHTVEAQKGHLHYQDLTHTMLPFHRIIDGYGYKLPSIIFIIVDHYYKSIL